MAGFLRNDRGHYENCLCPVNENKLKKMFKKVLCLKAKHSDSEFYYPEEQETADRNVSRRCRHFDKVEASGDTGSENEKLIVPIGLIFVIKSAI